MNEADHLNTTRLERRKQDCPNGTFYPHLNLTLNSNFVITLCTDIVALPFCHIALTSQRPISTPYPKELKTIGDHLRKRRLDLELLQKDVARLIGITEATIYDWESNRTSPRFRYTPKIIEFLGYWPYNTPATTLGARITRSRKLLGISQRELAMYLGVDQSTEESWEHDEHKPLKRYLEKLRSYLNIKIS